MVGSIFGLDAGRQAPSVPRDRGGLSAGSALGGPRPPGSPASRRGGRDVWFTDGPQSRNSLAMEGGAVTIDPASPPVDALPGRRRSAALVLAIVGVVVTIVGVVVIGVGGGLDRARYQRLNMDATSMAPTLRPGQELVVRRGEQSAIQRGDVVVFSLSAWSDSGILVKRVVGVGGDIVQCCDAQGRLVVNGRSINEDYLNLDGLDPAGRTSPYTASVPVGMVFVLGDDRGNSRDSRAEIGTPSNGAVPLSAVQGRVVGAYSGSDYVRLPLTRAFHDAELGELPLGDGLSWREHSVLTVVVGVGVFIGLLGVVVLIVAGAMAVFSRLRRSPGRRNGSRTGSP
jgi:signal peptidase I